MPGLLSPIFRLDPPPPETRPAHERRRARPYYHRHELRTPATWLDWLMALAVASVIAAAIEWAGAWPV